MKTHLNGVVGTNPRDFLAMLGLLRIVNVTMPQARLAFTDDGAYTPYIVDVDKEHLVDSVMNDVEAEAGERPWRLSYEKPGKQGAKKVFDLKPPPAVFREFLRAAVGDWIDGRVDGAEYGAAFATDVAVDGKGNTKPTAFHFTAANQQFLDTIERLRAMIDHDWVAAALFKGHVDRSGPNVRWDLGSERMYALMANDPNDDGTTVNAPLEWLAFRGLVLFPVAPRGARAETTGVRGRGNDMTFSWVLWSEPVSISTVRSLVVADWDARAGRGQVGIIATCTSEIRRSAQGFGNFGPAAVRP